MGVSFVLICVEQCGARFELSLAGGVTLDGITDQLRRTDWLVSVLSPPACADILMGPLCPRCAKKVYPAEMRAKSKWRGGKQ